MQGHDASVSGLTPRLAVVLGYIAKRVKGATIAGIIRDLQLTPGEARADLNDLYLLAYVAETGRRRSGRPILVATDGGREELARSWKPTASTGCTTLLPSIP